MSNTEIIEGIVYSVTIRDGVEPILPDLDPGQLVGWGDGKTNHKLFTPLRKATPEEMEN